MSGEPKYVIKSLEDFLSIPVEKLAECLQDFGSMLSNVHQEFLSESLEENPQMGDFVWVDDGLHEGRLELDNEKGTALD